MKLERIDEGWNISLLGANLTLAVLKNTLPDLANPIAYRLVFYKGKSPQFRANISILEMRELAKQANRALGISDCEDQQKQSKETADEADDSPVAESLQLWDDCIEALLRFFQYHQGRAKDTCSRHNPQDSINHCRVMHRVALLLAEFSYQEAPSNGKALVP